MTKSCFLKVAMLVFAMSTVIAYAGDGQIDFLPNGTETFTISESGSYVLTDNVTMTADVTCIEVNVNNVTIDLNGHALTGTGAGGLFVSGIYAQGLDMIFIRNGTVRSFADSGIVVGNKSRISNIMADSNGGDGVQAGEDARIINVIATGNAKCGIRTERGGLVQSCNTSGNNSAGSNAGIRVEENSTVTGCVSYKNSYTGNDKKFAYGIRSGDGCTIVNNSCHDNDCTAAEAGGGAYGISAGKGSVVKDNACYNNASGGERTLLFGIYAGQGSTITGNACYDNKAAGEESYASGIYCTGGSLAANNTCLFNKAEGSVGYAYGIWVSGDNTIVRGNTSSGNSGNSMSFGISAQGNGIRIEDNLCADHVSGTGINVSNGKTDCVVIRNTTRGNATGISMGNGGHYYAENMCKDGIKNTTGSTAGTGDRSNITF